MTDALSILGDALLERCGGSSEGGVKSSDVLKEKISLFYFSAHWCPPCRRFTPALVALYKKLKDAGKNFEVVFVSLDNSLTEYKEYTSEMPWLAVPFAEEDKRMELAKACGAEGIPHLVVLDADGTIITKDGVEAVQTDEEGKQFPWRPPSFDQIWPSFCLSKNETGEVVSLPSSDLTDKYLMLYFSAHWCPPCRGFTPKLSAAYTDLKKERSDFELVFVSSDRDMESFKEYYAEMTFCALPFEEREAKGMLSRRFGIRGIPSILILGPADEKGERPLINDNIRSVIENRDFAGFPFPKKNFGDLESAEDLNDKKCLIVLNENGDDDEQEETKEIVKEVAEKLKEDKGMSFYWALGPGGIGGQVRKLTKKESEMDGPVVLLLDIPDNGGYYVGQISELTAENVLKFVETPGERRQLSRG
eukprot:CAMPEP_0183299684 /NCGR_PEP_ID=MMETSP0160_2-20130417/6346_1 /TAXON_ID=2839 ORGANISM="Odontella Sinensis, Strain Grunow 1884" /NCGR_SAMPLE_ID=MMETSP0160_2 /ASSEMBLY_ACC=CAM_ASM_000250 /LENGTH=418 /DNA_ID=CAMNT_0025461973 /DNA_START=86 /DNA_END=1342 /DNA_ORIENTATION=+